MTSVWVYSVVQGLLTYTLAVLLLIEDIFEPPRPPKRFNSMFTTRSPAKEGKGMCFTLNLIASIPLYEKTTEKRLARVPQMALPGFFLTMILSAVA